MRRIIWISLMIVLVLLISSLALAENAYILYGFKIGQKMATVEKQLGQPTKVFDFEDGYKAFVFVREGHYVVFETSPLYPEVIRNIQLTGNSNPKNLGLGEVNLGDPVKKISKVFGKPDRQRNATDEITGQVIPNTVLYFYKYFNISFESSNNKISSMKIIYPANLTIYSDGSPDLMALLSTLNNKNYYGSCSVLAADLEIVSGNSFGLQTSILDSIQNDPKINELLFNPKTGLISIKKDEIIQTDPYLSDDGSKGYKFLIKKEALQYQIIVIPGFEKWVIKRIEVLQ